MTTIAGLRNSPYVDLVSYPIGSSIAVERIGAKKWLGWLLIETTRAIYIHDGSSPEYSMVAIALIDHCHRSLLTHLPYQHRQYALEAQEPRCRGNKVGGLKSYQPGAQTNLEVGRDPRGPRRLLSRQDDLRYEAEAHCSRTARCALCAGKHQTKNHRCRVEGCQAEKGQTCAHVTPGCTNHHSPHFAIANACAGKNARQGAKGGECLSHCAGRGTFRRLPPEAPADERDEVGVEEEYASTSEEMKK